MGSHSNIYLPGGTYEIIYDPVTRQVTIIPE
jgi:hypothetical protein